MPTDYADLLQPKGAKPTPALNAGPDYSDLLQPKPKPSGTFGAYGQTIKQAVKGIPSYLASAVEGATPYDSNNYLDSLQGQQKLSDEQFINAPNAGAPVLGGLATEGDIRGVAPSLSGSFAGMAPTLAGAAAGSLAGPIGTVVGGLAGAGLGLVGMKRAAENQFIRQNIEKENSDRASRGYPALNQQESASLQDKINATGDTSRMGYSEALPETIGNVAQTALLATPIGRGLGAIQKLASPLARALAVGGAKVAGTLATEAGEEEVTRQLQNPIMQSYGFPEQGAAETLKQTAIATLPFAAFGGGVGAYQGYRAKPPIAGQEEQGGTGQGETGYDDLLKPKIQPTQPVAETLASQNHNAEQPVDDTGAFDTINQYAEDLYNEPEATPTTQGYEDLLQPPTENLDEKRNANETTDENARKEKEGLLNDQKSTGTTSTMDVGGDRVDTGSPRPVPGTIGSARTDVDASGLAQQGESAAQPIGEPPFTKPGAPLDEEAQTQPAASGLPKGQGIPGQDQAILGKGITDVQANTAQTSAIDENDLGENIQEGGNSARGVHVLKSDPTRVVKVMNDTAGNYEEAVRLLNSAKDLPPSVARVHKVSKSKSGRVLIEQDRVKGKSIESLTNGKYDQNAFDFLNSIPQAHYDQLVNDVRQINKSGANVDLSNRDNLFYDPGTGFHFIDLQHTGQQADTEYNAKHERTNIEVGLTDQVFSDNPEHISSFTKNTGISVGSVRAFHKSIDNALAAGQRTGRPPAPQPATSGLPEGQGIPGQDRAILGKGITDVETNATPKEENQAQAATAQSLSEPDYVQAGLGKFKAENPTARPIEIQGERLRLRASYGQEAQGTRTKKKPVAKDTDELKTAIMRLGGIKYTGNADRAGFTDFKKNKFMFHDSPRAKTLDGMAESLRELGFTDINGENDLTERLYGSLNGTPHHTPAGAVKHAETMAREHYEDVEQARAHHELQDRLDGGDLELRHLEEARKGLELMPESRELTQQEIDDYWDGVGYEYQADETGVGRGDKTEQEGFKGIPGFLEGQNATGANKLKAKAVPRETTDLFATPEQQSTLKQQQAAADLSSQKEAKLQGGKNPAADGGELFQQPDIAGQADIADVSNTPIYNQGGHDYYAEKTLLGKGKSKAEIGSLKVNLDNRNQEFRVKVKNWFGDEMKGNHPIDPVYVVEEKVYSAEGTTWRSVDANKVPLWVAKEGHELVQTVKKRLGSGRVDIADVANEAQQPSRIDELRQYKTHSDRNGYLSNLGKDEFNAVKDQASQLQDTNGDDIAIDRENESIRRAVAFHPLNEDRKENLADYKKTGEITVQPVQKTPEYKQAGQDVSVPKVSDSTPLNESQIESPKKEFSNAAQNDLFKDLADKTADAGWRTDALRYPKVVNAKTGTVKTGITTVKSPSDALHIVESFEKNAHEQMLAIVLDKDGKVIQVVRHTSGLVDSSMVDVGILAGSIHDIPGASSVYFAHNHPTKNSSLSDADRVITDRLSAMLKGTGVKSNGMLVIAGDGKGSFYHKDYDGNNIVDIEEAIKATPATRTTSLPVTERLFESNDLDQKDAVTSPETAKAIAKKIANGNTGVLLLNNNNNPVGFVEMTVASLSLLRTGKGSGASLLLKEMHASNARALIGVMQGELSTPIKTAANNLSKFAKNTGNTRLLDVLVGAKSLAEEGQNFDVPGVYFSKATSTTGSTTTKITQTLRKEYGKVFDKLLERGRKGLKGGVVIVDSANSLPDGIRGQVSKESGVQGLYNGSDGITYLLAGNLNETTAIPVFAHEVVHAIDTEKIRQDAQSLIASRNSKLHPPKLREFLASVHQRMVKAGVEDDPTESANYVVENALLLGRQDGFSVIDTTFMDHITKVLGKRVADIVRKFVAAVRVALLKRGVSIQMSVDDMVAFARAGVIQAARGDINISEGLSKSEKPKTTTIDGKERPTTNSEGKPIAQTEEGLRNFYQWFSDSVATDKQGRPLVVYHGSSQSITEFKRPTNIQNTGEGIYFSDRPEVAKQYGDVLHPSYLRIESPDQYDANGKGFNDLPEATSRALKNVGKFGQDGIIINNIYDHPTGARKGKKSTVYVVEDASQIKSSIGNTGAFDKTNPAFIDVDGELRQRFNSNGDLIHHTDEGIRNFWKWFGDSEVVDDEDRPLVVYHGSESDFNEFKKDLLGTTTGAKSAMDGFFFSDNPYVSATYVLNDSNEFIKLGGKPAFTFLDIAKRLGANDLGQASASDVADAINALIPIQLKKQINTSMEGRLKRTHVTLGNIKIGVDFESTGMDGKVRKYSNLNDEILNKQIPKLAIAVQSYLNNPDKIRSFYLKSNKIKSVDYRARKFRISDKSPQGSRNDGVELKNISDPILANNYIVYDPSQIKSATQNTGAFDKTNPDIRYSKASDAVAAITPSDTTTDRFIYNFQDRFIRLKRQMQKVVRAGGKITDDPRMAEELYHQRAAHRIKAFYDQEMNPILQGLHKAGLTLEGFQGHQGFLHARHAIERNKAMAEINPSQAIIDAKISQAEADLSAAKDDQAKATAEKEMSRWKGAQAFKGTEAQRLSLSGMSDQEAKAFMDNLTPKEKLAYTKLGKDFDAITNGTLDLMTSYRLEKQDFVDGLKSQYQHYAPMYRDNAHPDDLTHPQGMGFSVHGTGLKAAVGSNQEVTNILAHAAAQREAMLRRGEKNLVTVKLANFILAHPDKDFAEVGKVPTIRREVDGLVDTLPDPLYMQKDNVVMMRVEGKNVGIVFADKNPENTRLALSLKNLDGQQLEGFESFVAKGSRWIAAVNTQYNIVWGLFNFMRDVQGSLINLSSTPLAGKQAQVFKAIPSAMKIIWATTRGWNGVDPLLRRRFDQFNANGGTTGYSQMFADMKERGKSLQKELDAYDAKRPIKLFRAAVKFIEDFNAVSENAVRLATFMTGVDNNLSPAKSASIAKNISVNFNRKGAQTLKTNAYFAFFNASVQGTARMLETLNGPAGKKILLGGVGLGMASAFIGIAAMGDDEWDKIKDWEKDRSLIIPIGGKNYLKIPMPLGLNILPNIGRTIVESALGSDKVTPQARILHLFGQMLGTFSPLGGNDVISAVTPTVLDPGVNLLRNEDYSGKSIVQQDFNSLDPTPGFSRAKDNATLPSKWFTEAVNTATGGTEFTPGLLSPTPDAIDYIFGEFFGGTGRELAKLASAASTVAKGDELPLHKVPLLGKLAGTTEGASIEKGLFYDNLKALNQHHNAIEGYQKSGRVTQAKEYLKEHPEASVYAKAHHVQTLLKKLKDRKEKLAAAGKPTVTIDNLIAAQIKRVNDEYQESLNR
mgnify:CR=1 FL=1